VVVREPEVQALADELDVVYTKFLQQLKPTDKDHSKCTGVDCNKAAEVIYLKTDKGLCQSCKLSLFQSSHENYLASYTIRRKAIEQESLQKPREYPWTTSKGIER
jgi:hypothetical protein